jgi:hypothetical protein
VVAQLLLLLVHQQQLAVPCFESSAPAVASHCELLLLLLLLLLCHQQLVAPCSES